MENRMTKLLIPFVFGAMELVSTTYDTLASSEKQDSLSQAERLRVGVQRNLSANVTADVDLKESKARYTYTFQNRSEQSMSLKLAYPEKMKKPFLLIDLPARGDKLVSHSEDLTITALSKKTRIARIHPNLYSIGDNEKRYLILMNYVFDFTIQLPESAKVLKSVIPFEKQSGNRLTWKATGKTVVPPIDLWYTLADENVSVTKESIEEKNGVTFAIKVKNESVAPVKDLRLRAQFPKGVYDVDEGQSDGKFRLLDDNTYRWYGTINKLVAGQTTSLQLVLKKINNDGQPVDLEILVYNKDGDLIVIAATRH